MAKLAKFLQGVAGAAGGAGLNVEEVFSTYLYEGQENRVVKSEITSSESRTDNHIAYSFTLANNLGSSYTNTAESNLTTDADLSILSRSASSTVDNYTDRKLAMGLYSSSSEGKYYQSLYKNTSTVDSFSVAGTFPYGTATGVSVVEVRNGFNFSSSTAVQSGDLLLFVAVGKNSSYAAASGFTEIDAVTETGGTYGFMARIAAKVADGTENGTDFGDNFLLSTSGSEYGILLRKTGGSWDISGAASGAALTSNQHGVSTLITNSIDLDGEGGLVWAKRRDGYGDHWLVDTERGLDKSLKTNTTDTNNTGSQQILSFNSDGFTLGNRNEGQNYNGLPYASWTFRKAPKFFDVVTYTGDGVAGREIAHNLGAEVGMMIIKSTSVANSNWIVYHRSNANTEFMYLNGTVAKSSGLDWFNSTTPTTTTFTVNNYTKINGSGETFVAYLFAHNDSNGGFGPDGDADIIKCGSYTGNGSSTGPEIDLGFEPQWVLVKCATAGGSSPAYEWYLMDTMRGMTGEDDTWITVNSNVAESSATYNYVKPEPTGFKIQSGQSRVNASGETYIYIAIRRGPMAVPESATDVFDIAFDGALDTNKPYVRSDLNYVDMTINNSRTGTTYHRIGSRLTQGRYLDTNFSSAETTSSYYQYDFQNGWFDLAASNSINTNGISWMWKRAPNYFDVVAYTGDGTASHTINHNLGVVPEMIWTKNRSSATALDWAVYHSGIGRKLLILNNTDAETSYDFFPYDPTSSNWIVRNHPTTNTSGDDYIMYLFASLDGVSKVGSYTGNGTNTNATNTQNIECGFAPRFVLVKASSTTGQWAVWDTERGIVAGDDPTLYLDSTSAEDTYDFIDPYATGFTITNLYGNYNQNGVDYIFYAIA